MDAKRFARQTAGGGGGRDGGGDVVPHPLALALARRGTVPVACWALLPVWHERSDHHDAGACVAATVAVTCACCLPLEVQQVASQM